MQLVLIAHCDNEPKKTHTSKKTITKQPIHTQNGSNKFDVAVFANATSVYPRVNRDYRYDKDVVLILVVVVVARLI